MAKKLTAIVRDLMKKEDRPDAGFRLALVMSQVGSIARGFTHDPDENPGARGVYKSKNEEALEIGQAAVQLVGYSIAREIDYEKAITLALENWVDADWRKREAAKKNEIAGKVACPGFAEGVAYLVSKTHPLSYAGSNTKNESRILVIEHAIADIAEVIKDVKGIVTDQGGYTCHAATIAREFNVPCIVGTGNATQLIKHGSRISMDASGEHGQVYLKGGF